MPRYIRPVGTARENPSCKPAIFEVEDGMDPLYESLLRIWKMGGASTTFDNSIVPPTPEQFEELKMTGLLALRIVLLDEVEEEDDGNRVVLWYETVDERGKPLGEPNLGFGLSDTNKVSGTNKYENTWVHAYDWTPPEARKAELESKSHDELVLLVLQLEA